MFSKVLRSGGALCLLLFTGVGCEEGDSPAQTDPSGTQEEVEQNAVSDGPSVDSSAELASCEPLTDSPTATWHNRVHKMLHEKCTVCHADTPLYGAPFSLASYSNLLDMAWKSETDRTFQAANRAIQNGTMPPPGQPMLTDDEKKAFQDWVSHCAPEGDPAEAEELEIQDKPQVPPAPEGLQIVHLDAGEFEVPVGQDQYMCFPFVLSTDGDKSIARIEYELDEAAVIHHMVLYADVDKVTDDEPFSCLQVPVEHSAFLFEWGPGGYPAHFPDNAGIPVQDGDKLILQVHYSNTQGLEGLRDSSGLRVFLDEPRENEISMFASGPLAYAIPPFTEVEVESTCVFDKPIQILSSTPHMHESGRFFRTELIRANGDVETVVQLDQWNFFEQPMYDTPLQIEPGDALRTVCKLENTSSVSLYSGETTEDEMCFNFMYHTPPIGALFCDTGQAIEAPPIPEEEPPECPVEEVAPPDSIELSEILGAVPPFFSGMETLPEGDWMVTEAKLYLPHFSQREYKLIHFDQSAGLVSLGMNVQGDEIQVKLGLSFLMVVVSGGVAERTFKANLHLTVDYDESTEALVVEDKLCSSAVGDINGKVKYLRLQQDGERLIGFIKVLRSDEQEEAILEVVMERP